MEQKKKRKLSWAELCRRAKQAPKGNWVWFGVCAAVVVGLLIWWITILASFA